MAHYLIEVGYTPQSWATQIDTPANAAERITPALKACGAKLECLYYAFGDSDVVGVIDFKTPEDAAAFALAIASSGALRSFKTTPLLTIDQGITSLKRAAELRSQYSPPITVDVTDKAKAKAKA
ncbi:MAG: hypothetical protein QOJ34_3262 [Pseudonocardiales bacterium]|jgi:uncharacterized protein with GYD domain|nr:hypothetical protein [Pseudonocardiales bacterium]